MKHVPFEYGRRRMFVIVPLPKFNRVFALIMKTYISSFVNGTFWCKGQCHEYVSSAHTPLYKQNVCKCCSLTLRLCYIVQDSNPILVAFYNTHGDRKDLFFQTHGSSRGAIRFPSWNVFCSVYVPFLLCSILPTTHHENSSIAIPIYTP